MADESKEKLISAETADALISAHDGDVALYCLYLTRHPEADDEKAAAALCRTIGEIAAAREKLGRILHTGDRIIKVPPADEVEQYTSRDIVSTCKQKAFEPILEEMTRILGATPSVAYLNALVDIYDRLGMPPEVIMLLLNFCDAETRRRWGPGRRPTPKNISEEAYRWANREIMTMELAEQYIARRERENEDKNRITSLLGIRGRNLSPSETKHVEQWLEMGFPDDVIYAAYDRTTTKLGALNWAYMSGILKKWDAAGLHDLSQIEEAEGKRAGKGRPEGRGHSDPVNPEDMKKFMGENR